MFAIHILPRSESCPDGEPLAEITIGDFSERFQCTPSDSLESEWREQLQALVNGQTYALLAHDPRFAWVVYREGETCFVQQRFSRDGAFAELTPRMTATEDGHPVSEWQTSVAEIRAFVYAEQST